MGHPVVYSGDLNALMETYKNKYAGRDQECVALPQAVTNVGHTSKWQPGDRVVDLNILRSGTVIANFLVENGKARFPNKHGYHAAIFLEFGNRNPVIGGYTHFWVIDQWPGKHVKRRNKNSFTPEEAKRRQILPGDNANEYYVVMVP